MKATSCACNQCLPSDLTQDDLDEIAVFTFRVGQGILAAATAQASERLTPEIVRRRKAFVEEVRQAEKRIIEIKRADPRRLAAAIGRLRARDQYGEHAETGVLAT